MNDTPGTAHVPDCDRYARCGGCGLMSLDYQAQRAEKSRLFVAHWQAAGLPPAPPSWVLSAQPPLDYRNRVRCQVTPEGRVRFFNPEKLDTCAVLEPSVRDGVDLAQRIALDHPTAMRHFASLEVRGRDSSGRAAVHYRNGMASDARATGSVGQRRDLALLAAAWPSDWLVAGLGDEPFPCQRWHLTDDVWIDVPIDAFLQVNTRVNRLLVAHVTRGIVARGAKSFVDLFMGAGNFALPLLAAGLEGQGVELHAGAVDAARRAALAQKLSFEHAEAADAALWVQARVEVQSSVDVVIADPPRAGLGAAAVSVARLAARSVVLCSCNFRSLARDVAVFVEAGFAVEHVALFDMFPQTPELESVVWLERKRALNPG